MLSAAAVLLAACGGAPGPGGEAADLPTPTVRTGTSGPIASNTQNAPALPLDGYGGTDAQNDVLDRAVELLTQKCMRQKGFDYTIAAQNPAGRRDRTLFKGAYGITDKAQAAQYGYRDPGVIFVDGSGKVHLPPGVSTEDPKPQGADYRIALEGSADGPLTDENGRVKPVGCRNEALYRIYDYDAAQKRADLNLPGRLAAEANDRAAHHPQVTAAVSAWSACMAKKGYKYSTPQDPLNASWPTPPDQRQIDTALSDIACKEQTGLVATWLNAITAYQQELIDRNGPALAELKKIYDEQVKRAEAALAGR